MPEFFTCGIVYLYLPETAPNGLGIEKATRILGKSEILG